MAGAAPVVDDLRAESDDLDALVGELSSAQWATATPAPGWTIAHQIAHLLWTDRVRPRARRFVRPMRRGDAQTRALALEGRGAVGSAVAVAVGQPDIPAPVAVGVHPRRPGSQCPVRQTVAVHVDKLLRSRPVTVEINRHRRTRTRMFGAVEPEPAQPATAIRADRPGARAVVAEETLRQPVVVTVEQHVVSHPVPIEVQQRVVGESITVDVDARDLWTTVDRPDGGRSVGFPQAVLHT
ncbi:MAG: maleylpyruvate isomerase N-terminal domain-containing protein [Mycobacterium sp.]